jgi:hypothetical protein
MSFKAREIMIDVLPAARPFRRGAPGFGLCGEATRTEDDDEDDDLDCGEATRPPSGVTPEADLAVLRQHLRRVLSAEMTP